MGRILTAEIPQNDEKQIFFLTFKMPWIVISSINWSSSFLEEKYKKHIKKPFKNDQDYPYNFKYLLLPFFESWPNFESVFHIWSLNIFLSCCFYGLTAVHNVHMILSLFGTFNSVTWQV